MRARRAGLTGTGVGRSFIPMEIGTVRCAGRFLTVEGVRIVEDTTRP